MLFWTNDPNWAIADPSPAQLSGIAKSIELFLFQFQDKRFHEHLTGDCDVAFLNVMADNGLGDLVPMALRWVIPRDEGTRREIVDWWHPATTWHWRYSSVGIGPQGWTGGPDVNPQFPNRRYKVESYLNDETLLPESCLDAIDIFPGLYGAFLEHARGLRLTAFGVGVGDGRKLIELTPMRSLQGFKHQAFTLEREYSLEEYLPPVGAALGGGP